MKLTFRLRFRTQPGQSLLISGNHELLGGGEMTKAIPLQFLNEEFWQVSISFPADAANAPLTILYFSKLDGSQIADWGRDRF